MPWTHNYTALGNSLALTSLVVAIPIFFMFWALAVKKMKGHVAGVWTLIITLVDVVLVYKMPVGTALSAAGLGILNGLFPIAWIVLTAVFLYNLTVESGHFEVIKSSISSLSNDRRIQALLVAFSFGAFLEGAAGFGAPVAITAALLIGLGFEPLYAAGICLIANTAPVAFGAIGAPIVAAGAVTGMGDFVIAQAIGRQLPFLSVLVPFYLVVLMSGWKGAKEVMPAILVSGVSFASAQFLSSNYLGAYLPDIISSLFSLIATAVFLKFWKPKNEFHFPNEKEVKDVEVKHHSVGETIRAWSPFIILTVMVAIWGTPSFKAWVNNMGWFVNIAHWPGLDGLVYKAAPIVAKPAVYAASFKWDFFSAGGTAILITAIISMFILGVSPSKGLKVFGNTLNQLKTSILTIAAVLGFAYLANYSGLSYTLGLLLASTGKLFPLLSPVLGWMGVFLTGSDTSSNALFAKLQQVTAQQIGVNPVLTVAANSSGGVVGKMISPQSIAVAAAATGLVGRESELFRFTLKHSAVFLAAVIVIIGLQAYLFPGMMPSVAAAIK
ncbi:lactate permease LctP family transporter [Desulfitobacterium sp.]|uniref:L-lactate permease n=1 Tax=Desulfitobacterium sp. TaxID=49981 RepID=UPI002C1DACF3|nr:lactate permease LctP family transporter [Desulfitobacterium sp.]HVJ48369.1 lactate permease LctP family transporter [Desulfitobacterium sp.]